MAWTTARPAALFGLIFGGVAYVAIKALYRGADSGVLWWGLLRKRR